MEKRGLQGKSGEKPEKPSSQSGKAPQMRNWSSPVRTQRKEAIYSWGVAGKSQIKEVVCKPGCEACIDPYL